MSDQTVLTQLSEMIEEAQREANRAPTELQRIGHLAQRDALTEVKFRLRDGRRNPEWTRLSANSIHTRRV